MEECKYEWIEEVFNFDNDFDLDPDSGSYSNFEEQFVYNILITF